VATVQKYGNTGLEYIEGSMRYMFRETGQRNGIIITKQEFNDWHREGSLFARILSVKDEEGRNGWDFAYAAEHGKYHALDGSGRKPKNLGAVEAKTPLVNNATDEQMGYSNEDVEAVLTNPYLPADYKKRLESLQTPDERRALFNEFIKDNEPPVETNGKVKQKKKMNLAGIHSSRDVMIWVMLIIGAGSLIMSCYHITRYLWEARGPEVSVITGIIMGMFAAAAFTTGRYFWYLAKKEGRPSKAWPDKTVPKLKDAIVGTTFWVFGAAVVVFSMFATMRVNYDDFKAMTDRKVAAAVTDDVAVKAVNQKDADLRKEADRLDALLAAADAEKKPWLDDIERLTRQRRNTDLTNMTSEQVTAFEKSIKAELNNAQYRVNVIENRVKADRDKRGKIGDTLTGTGESAVAAVDNVKVNEEKGTLFSLLHDIFGWEISTMELIVYVLPALFYDVMAPFALTVVLILAEKREEDKLNGPDGS
jgi:hypothetical protein